MMHIFDTLFFESVKHGFESSRMIAHFFFFESVKKKVSTTWFEPGLAHMFFESPAIRPGAPLQICALLVFKLETLAWDLHMHQSGLAYVNACKNWDLHMYLHIAEVAAWLSCMVFAWVLHGFCMVFAWVLHGFAWYLHGVCMGAACICKSHASPTIRLWAREERGGCGRRSGSGSDSDLFFSGGSVDHGGHAGQ